MDSLLQTKVDTLNHYLNNLPNTIPLPEPGLATYAFDLFDISAEDIEDYGEIGAVNRQLEIAFGSRHDGPITFTERGSPLTEVVNILHNYLLKEPASVILRKWVDDQALPPAGRSAPRPRLANNFNTGSDESSIDNGNKWLDEMGGLDPTAAAAERHTFTLGGRTDIDLNSPFLRDVLSDSEIIVAGLVGRLQYVGKGVVQTRISVPLLSQTGILGSRRNPPKFTVNSKLTL